MQNEAFAARGRGQREFDQHLAVAAFERDNALEGRTVTQTHRGELRIQRIAAAAATLHARAQHGEVERIGCGNGHDRGAALTMQAFIGIASFAELTRDLELQPVRTVREYHDADPGFAFDHDRLRPHDMSQLQRQRRVRRPIGRWQGIVQRGARHLQIRHRRQHRTAVDAVIGEEELGTVEDAGITLLAEVGDVAMQERMQHRGDWCSPRAAFWPAALTRERISRQRHAARCGGAVQLGPIQRHPADPQIEHLRQMFLCDPAVDHPTHLGIGGERGQGIVVTSDAAVHAFDTRRTVDDALQLLFQLRLRFGDHCEAMRHRVTTHLQRVSDARKIQRAFAATQEGEQIARLLKQLLIGARRQRYRHRPDRIRQCKRGLGTGQMLFDHQMRIGTAETERTHGGHARDIAVPGAGFGVDVERRPLEVDVRIRRAVVDRRHQSTVLHAQQHLDDAGHARGETGVTDVALHRPQRAAHARARSRAAAEGGGERIDLDRVAQRRGGTVRFNVGNARRVDVELGVDLPQQLLLRVGAGRGDAVGLAVLIGTRTADHAEDVVAIAFGVGQRLQQQHAAAFGKHDAVGGRVEGRATTVARWHAHLRSENVAQRRGQQIDAAGQRQTVFAAADAFAGQMHRHQRR